MAQVITGSARPNMFGPWSLTHPASRAQEGPEVSVGHMVGHCEREERRQMDRTAARPTAQALSHCMLLWDAT